MFLVSVLTLQFRSDFDVVAFTFQKMDLLKVLIDYVDLFYDFTSKSLFLRFVHLSPPQKNSDPEEAALWLWNVHNKVKNVCLSKTRHQPMFTLR